jgi:hypothetical protein
MVCAGQNWSEAADAIPDVNLTVHLPDELLDEMRRLVREEVERASTEQSPGLFNVKNAAAYLDTSEEALRGLMKRRQIEFNRSETGRITFTREQLDAHAKAELLR